MADSFLRRMWRKHLIVPTEHGSWSWMLVPFGVGVLVAQESHFTVWLTLMGGLSLFFMRQPAMVWTRARRGRARRTDGTLALGWLALLCLIGLLSLIGLLWAGRWMLLWMLIPITAVFSIYLFAAKQGQGAIRTLWMELAGAVALAGMAPAALIAAEEQLSTTAWVLWLVMGIQNVVGVIYVRLRIADTHKRPYPRRSVILIHAGAVGLIVLLSLFQLAPIWLFVPFGAMLIRAIWAVANVHPIESIKQFGFTEIGVEIASGIWIVIVWQLFL